jgi:hypothetical protein
MLLGTEVEPSTHNPKIEDSNPAENDKMAENVVVKDITR